VARTFDTPHLDEIGRTAYFSANSHAQTILETRQQDEDGRHLSFRLLRNFPTVGIASVGKVEYVFTYEPMGEAGALGHRNGGTPPRYVTDRAIALGREGGFDRLILHYFQPHSPWVSRAMAEGRDLDAHERGFTYLTETGDRERPWEAYLADLRWVLDDVGLLLDNIDADRAVITAYHGDAFGEWGVMSHKIGSIHPHIRKVPWAVTEGVDFGGHEPTVDDPGRETMDGEELDRQLRVLGYRI
jgi:hypothetical protein